MSDSASREDPRHHQSTNPSGPLNHAAAGPLLDGTAVEQADTMANTLGYLSKRVEKIAVDMEKAQLQDYVQLALHPWQLIWRNLLYGTARGIGIALGFTFFAATIVWLLQILGKLNLPIVGDYIADIVRIVQRQLQIKPY